MSDILLTRGAVRPGDGYRFFGYEKRHHGFREKWCSPEAWSRMEAKKSLRKHPPRLSSPKKWSSAKRIDHLRERVIQLLERGLTTRRIAEALLCSTSTVCLISRPWREGKLQP